MNRSNLVVGALGGLVLVLCAALLWNGHGLSLANLPGLVLVAGGTLLASVIGHSAPAVLGLLRRLPRLLREPRTGTFEDRRALLQVAALYRRGDLRGAERGIAGFRDSFLRDGARLALDPHNGEELTRMLQWRIRQCKDQDSGEVRILRTMAGFAPAFGMLGTLFGLVSLLGDLGQADLQGIGVTMGFALMTTLYGLLAANLLLRPLALKLEDRSRRRLQRLGLLLEAVLMLYERQHPTLVAEYLDNGFGPAPAEEPESAAEPQAATPTPAPGNLRRLAWGRA
jgi:chemotaxis protein MotA